MVLLNSTTAFLIGGQQEETNFKPYSYLLNTEANSQEWIQGPTLNLGRNDHSCARIRKDASNLEFSTIVVGGYNGTIMKSVEILDDGASEWRNGPDLPFGIRYASLVEDPAGGIILVGGFDDNYHLNTLFKLSDAGDEAQWIEMPQKLKLRRSGHISFLVPDGITSCSVQ